jgi:multisubunit Na+/H+ antiporter MnhC subunit
MRSILVFITCSLAITLTGCLHPKIGPKSLAPDRAAYSAGIGDSWKEQMLLNIVKLRYIDAPIFVDISSITAGYSLTQTASVAGQVTTPGAATSESVGAGAAFGYTPTITYSPLTGSAFIQGLLTPLPPALVFGAIQNGVAADLIMLSAVVSINGLKNQQATLNGITPADPGFDKVRKLVREIQLSGGVRTYVKPEEKGPATVVAFTQSGYFSRDPGECQRIASPAKAEPGRRGIQSRPGSGFHQRH